ncbi:MAG TPA: sodium:glutamate symporter [Clostridiales bacterium]|nr:sodium:glutamate symporter [Clostridiales bacterium]
MNFSASNTMLWDAMIQFGILSTILLAANVLRRKVAIVRKSLAPTAVIGGFLALLLRIFGLIKLDGTFLDMITYHTIAIGFIALSLRIPEKRPETAANSLDGPKSGALIVSCYLVQGILGILITAGLAYTFMPGLFKAAGILLPMGYGQGPGQANNVGATYEQLGFAGGQSFGLSLAAAGFLCACMVGVIYINILHKHKRINIQTIQEKAEALTIEDFQSENEIPVSQSVDRLSIQTAMVFVVYLATYLVSLGITSLLEKTAPGISATVSPLIWGFNFIVGSLAAMLFRQSFNWFTKAKWMKRQYPNNYLLSRLSGCAFDYMIVAGIAAIDIKDLSGLWIPFIILSILGGWVTLVYLKWLCKKLYPAYYYEGLLSMYGMMTGTISSGVMLLRELDPNYRTPAANNLLTGSSYGILFGAPMLILIGMAPKSDLRLLIVLLLQIIYLIFLLLFMLRVKPGRKS